MPCNLSQKNNIITQCNEKKISVLCLPVTFSKSLNIKGKFFYIMVIINLNVLCKNAQEFPAIIDPFTFRGPLLARQGNNNILLATQMCGQDMLQELIII